MQLSPQYKENLLEFTIQIPHPFRLQLVEILAGASNMTSSGFPFISEESFEVFKAIPHLFTNGQCLLLWMGQLEQRLTDSVLFSEEELGHLERIIKVLRTVTYTASITAPSDLWILRHILSVHKDLGTLDFLAQNNILYIEKYATTNNLDAKQLAFDIAFLYCRGYLSQEQDGYIIASCPQAKEVFSNITSLTKPQIGDWALTFINIFQDPGNDKQQQIQDFFSFPKISPASSGWQAGIFEIETGYRLVPLVLGLRALEWTKKLKVGTDYNIVPDIPKVKEFLQSAGMIDKTEKVTFLGERIFARGAGPFGIIHAYFPYMENLEQLLRGKTISSWVNRGENVAASQDANRKTFLTANRSLDKFCQKYSYRFNVFIEHAVGQGEATRQRFEANGEENIQYFGADLEQAAIAKSVANQKRGILPKNMIFIQADIGAPKILIGEIDRAGYSTSQAVMLVGNGFHEIRQQTNDKMIEVFRNYQEAGILLIFTEESALSDQDLITTAWNTYHTGFRYVHELSGQGLRPAYDVEETARYSWSKCATLAGYKVLARYTTKTRTIYPYPRKNGYNPSISTNYFCVPEKLAHSLGI